MHAASRIGLAPANLTTTFITSLPILEHLAKSAVGKMIGPLTTTALIFGGCCVNVFALEAIVKYAGLEWNNVSMSSLIHHADSRPAVVSARGTREQ